MACEWPLRPLSEISVNFDALRRPVKELDRVAGPYPYYGASGIVDYVDGYLFDGEYVLVGEDGENLRARATPIAFRATGKFWVNNHAHILQGNDDALTRYLEYAIQGTDIGPYLTGAVMPKLTQGNLKRVLVPCPPRRAQEQIVSVLGALDDRIDLLRQTNVTLEAIAQTLFKSWFVDFDPVRAKAEGREPEGMDPATAALFPSEFEESELGLIPKGWRWSTLGHVTAQKGGVIQTGPFGSQLHASDYQPVGVPVVMPQDLAGRRVSEDRIARVSEGEADRLSRHRLKSGDIVFSRRGDVGRHAIVSGREVGWLCGTGCLLVRPAEDESISTFISAALARPESLKWLVRHAVGATMPNLNTKILSALPLVWPCDEAVRAYEALASPLDHRVSANLVQAQSLALLRDTLLPRLISGKLRLPEAEKSIEEAVA